MNDRNTILIYSDGGSRGNPGRAAIGYVIKTVSGEIIAQAGLKIGVATNNEAEYTGIISALQTASAIDTYKNSVVEVLMDSKLVVEQLSGHWRIKEARLASLAKQAKALEANFASVRYTHIPREKNSLADSLLNKALDS